MSDVRRAQVDILVVEDDDDLRGLLALALEAPGRQLRLAADGEEGLALVSRKLPDLVVMDVEMPRLSGPGMAHALIVQNAGREQIPIVIVSGSPGLKAISERVGTPYSLAKPFSAAQLELLVGRALAERRPPHPLPQGAG